MFVDRYNKCLLLFNDAGEFVRTVVTAKSELNDVCYLTENKVAVTDTNRGILMIDVKKNLIVKQEHEEVTNGDIINGICTFKQMIFVKVVLNTVLVLDFEFHVKNRIEIIGQGILSITVFRDKLYCADSKSLNQ